MFSVCRILSIRDYTVQAWDMVDISTDVFERMQNTTGQQHGTVLEDSLVTLLM
jgi:hypothetical protein